LSIEVNSDQVTPFEGLRAFTGCGKTRSGERDLFALKGRDFSRADKANKINRALQVAEELPPSRFVTASFFRAS
jgi:hypothetical protein